MSAWEPEVSGVREGVAHLSQCQAVLVSLRSPGCFPLSAERWGPDQPSRAFVEAALSDGASSREKLPSMQGPEAGLRDVTRDADWPCVLSRGCRASAIACDNPWSWQKGSPRSWGCLRSNESEIGFPTPSDRRGLELPLS